MENRLVCDICGFEDEELYEVDKIKYCDDCLESKRIISTETITTYYVNGEFCDDFYEAIEYLGAKIIN